MCQSTHQPIDFPNLDLVKMSQQWGHGKTKLQRDYTEVVAEVLQLSKVVSISVVSLGDIENSLQELALSLQELE